MARAALLLHGGHRSYSLAPQQQAAGKILTSRGATADSALPTR